MGYVPAEAHFTKKLTYVDCYAIHPDTGRMKRKRYRLNRIKSAAERKRHARDMVVRLNAKLAKGWVPWGHDEAPKSMHTLEEALAQWEVVKKRTRFSAPHNYLMQARLLRSWAGPRGLMEQPVGAFTKQHAIAYFDWLESRERSIKNNTYNGYLTIIRGFFRWAVKREFRTDNPFTSIERKRRSRKNRTFLTVEERRDAMAWFRQHDPPMVAVCLFVFHTLIRPRNELARLRVGDVDLDAGVLRFDADQTKTNDGRTPAMPPSMVAELRRTVLIQCRPTDFAVGKGLRPGPVPTGLNNPALRWGKMREALGWPASKQLMSLRDSGIIQLIRDGVSPEVVMKHADHKSLATTNWYIQHAFDHVQEEVRAKASAF